MRSALVLVGASGAGKTTVAARLIEKTGGFSMVRSITTRAPRGDGHDGEYIYTDREGFIKRQENGELLEYMEYGGNFYGTPISELERIFSEEKIPLLILDIEGVKSLRRAELEFRPAVIYIWGNLHDIERRLYERDLRDQPTADKLISFVKRKEMNVRDYLSMPDIAHLFDSFVENINIEDTARSVLEIFSSISDGSATDVVANREVAKRLRKMAIEN